MKVFRLIIGFCVLIVGALVAEGRSFDELHVAGSCEVHVICNQDSVGMLVKHDDAVNIKFSYAGASLNVSVPSVPGVRNLPKLTLYSDTLLRVVEVAGRAKVVIDEIKSGESLALVVSGASSMSIDDMSAPNINVSLSGSGLISISGELTASTLNFSVSGSGKIKADAVTASRMTVTQRGSGKLSFAGSARDCAVVERGNGSVELQQLVTGKLDLKIFGDGHIYYPAGVPVKLGGNTENIIQVKPYQPL
ncbi:MAG: DUF2807 domain-containing protein [Muribaculaceae bacterium]|nr:DUF2807 domain-containing protein [Muribaculaceae bacterium]